MEHKTMIPEARAIWSGLEFRRPLLFRNIEPLTKQHMLWSPHAERKCIAWQLWHIAEVEDTWIREMVTHEAAHFPFGTEVREAQLEDYPTKQELIDYFNDVREQSRTRLTLLTPEDLLRDVCDEDYGNMTVLDIWMGVVTSFAWHAGQIAMTAKMIPDSPISTLKFHQWRNTN